MRRGAPGGLDPEPEILIKTSKAMRVWSLGSGVEGLGFRPV